jgi:hypothetical protein
VDRVAIGRRQPAFTVEQRPVNIDADQPDHPLDYPLQTRIGGL